MKGFQWVDGSFVEDIEALEGRPPSDLDLVTFFEAPEGMEINAFSEEVEASFPEFTDWEEGKCKYLLDHYPVWLRGTPIALVEQTRYWVGLFSHQRLERGGAWKGMFKVALGTPLEDDLAREILKNAE